MRIFYITTEDVALQGDYLETMTLIGLRTVFGDNVIDLPRKKVMYGEFEYSPKDQLHGRGFSLFSRPIPNVFNRDVQPGPSDVLIYGVVPPTYGVKRRPNLEAQVGLIVVLDGHDDTRLRPEFLNDPKVLYFKRELVDEPGQNLRPINFSIPSWCIRPVNFALKKKLVPRTVPRGCFDENYCEQGRAHYVFNHEEDYYQDLQESWYCPTVRKGGWQQLRNLEGIAAGCVVPFKWIGRPRWILSDFPAPAFEYWDECVEEMNNLLESGGYLEYLNRQRAWLYQYGTCEAVATYVYNEIVRYMER